MLNRRQANRAGPKKEKPLPLISLHGGHSSDFCLHAGATLADILADYARKGFGIVGITEHMPPPNDDMRYPDEATDGISAAAMRDRFDRYFETVRRFQREYADRMRVLAGFETEWYSNALPLINELVSQHHPDYIIGSLHHVDDICFDYDADHYMRATAKTGGLNQLYARYFDLQCDMIEALNPAIVGHFDLIRIFDPDYASRISQPAIWSLIERNLQLVREKNLLLDLNMRAYVKGAPEPYPCRAIINRARELDIGMVPGDDSHDLAGVGLRIEQAIHMLDNLGFDTNWNAIVKQIIS